MMKKSERHIIDYKKDLPLAVQLRDFILTVLVWLLYFWFMRDFIVFTGDVIHWSFSGFNNTDSYYTFSILSTIISYFEVIIAMEIMFVAWSFYNLIRYGKKKRRRVQPAVSLEETAKTFHVDPADLEKWQKTGVLVMHHDKRGRLVDVQAS